MSDKLQLQEVGNISDLPWLDQMSNRKNSTKDYANTSDNNIRDTKERVFPSDDGASRYED